jgi:hypothetical protein
VQYLPDFLQFFDIFSGNLEDMNVEVCRLKWPTALLFAALRGRYVADFDLLPYRLLFFGWYAACQANA